MGQKGVEAAEVGSWEPSWDVLEIITHSSADGITIQDHTGRLLYANDAAARMSGFASGVEMQRASAEEIMERFDLLDETAQPFPVANLPSRRAMQGEQAPEALIHFRARSGGEDHWALVRATPLFDDEGEVKRVANVFMDVTAERVRRQERLFLAEATEELASSLDWEATLQRVARLAVPKMADWCSLEILQPDGSLALIALAHVDPEKVRWASELRERHPPRPSDTTGAAHVARTGESEIVPEITAEMIEASEIVDPVHRDAVEELRLSSIMTVPLIARGKTLGVLSLVWAESAKRYSPEDLALAEELATRAALAIDNARLYRDRDIAARSLQERLLPKKLPQIPGLEVAARYLPAVEFLAAGGDFYDLFEMDDGTWKAVIGDVCGKGPDAAALMGFVRFTTRAVSRQDTKPSEALVKLNRALLEELDGDRGRFCTAAVVRIAVDEGDARLTVAVGGHPLPLIVRADGRVEEAGTPGTLLGVVEDVAIVDRIHDLRPGDALVMVTDGVVEASADPAWRDNQLPRLLSSSVGVTAEAIAQRIETAISEVRERRTDDVAILVLRRPPLGHS